jgi:hypothetical protein
VKVPDEPAVDVEEAGLAVGEPATHAAGLKAVRISLTRALKQMGPVKSAKNLLALNPPGDAFSVGYDGTALVMRIINK